MSSVEVHRETVVNGVRLHYVESGTGPLVLLLHGFPEFWYSWRQQIPKLVGAGLRVIAPDLRGYNLSDKPQGRRAYCIRELVADMAGLIEQAGVDRAAVVGHEWGGIVAWYLAARRPELVERLVLLNAPPPPSALRELKTWEQQRKFFYVPLFRLPLLPEALLRARNMNAIERLFTLEPRRGFSEEEIEAYKTALSRKGALTAMVNYYRALFLPENNRELRDHGRIHAPTLLIWGQRDRHMVPGMA
ncbi:MAG: alpha/beta hydrolase, partial [Deltaproteobacteria bacterium]